MKKMIAIFLLLISAATILVFPINTLAADGSTNNKSTLIENLNISVDNSSFSDLYYTTEKITDSEKLEDIFKDTQLDVKKINSAVSISFLVRETYDINGNVLDNHLLTNQEYINELSNVNFITTTVSKKSSNNGKLTITFTNYSPNSKEYVLYGIAKWDTKSLIGGTNYPDAANYDYMGFTWTGGELTSNTDRDCTITYYDNTSSKGIFAYSNSKLGYCWKFKEKKASVGPNARTITCLQTLVKPSTKKNKTATARMTYIHTYSKGNASLKLSSDTPPKFYIPKDDDIKNWGISILCTGLSY